MKYVLWITLTVLLALIFYTLAWPTIWQTYLKPPILRDLPADARSATSVLADRVSEAFPVGSSAKKMQTQLKSQGFDVYEDAHDQHHFVARIDRSASFLVSVSWIIIWKTDNLGNVISTSANVGYTSF